jgi:hypothetical protein
MWNPDAVVDVDGDLHIGTTYGKAAFRVTGA